MSEATSPALFIPTLTLPVFPVISTIIQKSFPILLNITKGKQEGEWV